MTQREQDLTAALLAMLDHVGHRKRTDCACEEARALLTRLAEQPERVGIPNIPPQTSATFNLVERAVEYAERCRAAGYRAYVVRQPGDNVVHVTDHKRIGWGALPLCTSGGLAVKGKRNTK